MSTVSGKTLSGLTTLSSVGKSGSGRYSRPTLGYIVQRGKQPLCARGFDKQLKKADFPTLGSTTIPAFIIYFLKIEKIRKANKLSHSLPLYSSELVAAKHSLYS